MVLIVLNVDTDGRATDLLDLHVCGSQSRERRLRAAARIAVDRQVLSGLHNLRPHRVGGSVHGACRALDSIFRHVFGGIPHPFIKSAVLIEHAAHFRYAEKKDQQYGGHERELGQGHAAMAPIHPS